MKSESNGAQLYMLTLLLPEVAKDNIRQNFQMIFWKRLKDKI